MISIQCRIARHPDIAWRAVADEGLLVDPRKGKVYPLDPVSLRFWQQCDGSHTVKAIHQTLLQEFEVSEEELRLDLLQYAQELLAEDLVTIVSSQ